jgi:hypothetical protein
MNLELSCHGQGWVRAVAHWYQGPAGVRSRKAGLVANGHPDSKLVWEWAWDLGKGWLRAIEPHALWMEMLHRPCT